MLEAHQELVNRVARMQAPHSWALPLLELRNSEKADLAESEVLDYLEKAWAGMIPESM